MGSGESSSAPGKTFCNILNHANTHNVCQRKLLCCDTVSSWCNCSVSCEYKDISLPLCRWHLWTLIVFMIWELYTKCTGKHCTKYAPWGKCA